MIFVAQTNFIVSTLYYHLTLVRMLIILMQGNRQKGSHYWINCSEFKFYFNNMESKLIAKVKTSWACQTKERVNPHSQLCAHKPRFRPY
jgi:hypothetical protein